MKPKNKRAKVCKRVVGLSQEEILTGAVDTLNRLLVAKGIVTAKELQGYFEDWRGKWLKK